MTHNDTRQGWNAAMADWLSRRQVPGRTGGDGRRRGHGAAAARPAQAKTTITWMGWQGYETPIKSGTFLTDNDIDFQPTFIASNEEIITKLQAGGVGKTDLITMYFGYLPLMAEGGLAGAHRYVARRALRRSRPAIHQPECDQVRRQADGHSLELGLAADHVRSRRSSPRRRLRGSTS